VVTAIRFEAAETARLRYSADLVMIGIKMSEILGAQGLDLLTYIRRHWPKSEVTTMIAYGSKEICKEDFVRVANYYYDKPIFWS
jgi:DNA-binding NtrC family response regulator